MPERLIMLADAKKPIQPRETRDALVRACEVEEDRQIRRCLHSMVEAALPPHETIPIDGCLFGGRPSSPRERCEPLHHMSDIVDSIVYRRAR